jgi:predicted nucleotidyltransferase
MDLQTHLDNLQSHVADQLRTLPGATELYLFGSRAEAKNDEYADIDLQLVTAFSPQHTASERSTTVRPAALPAR